MFLDTGARPGATLAAVSLARYITHKTSLYDHPLAQRGRLQPRSLRQHRLLELGRPQPRDARKGHEEETKVEQRRRWDREGQEARRPADHANARAPAVRRLRRERYPRRVEPSYSTQTLFTVVSLTVQHMYLMFAFVPSTSVVSVSQ